MLRSRNFVEHWDSSEIAASRLNIQYWLKGSGNSARIAIHMHAHDEHWGAGMCQSSSSLNTLVLPCTFMHGQTHALPADYLKAAADLVVYCGG